MRPKLILGVTLLTSLSLAGTAASDIEILAQSAPDRPQDYVQAEAVPMSESLKSGEDVASVSLDDTGVANFRFINPRKPRSVEDTKPIEFVNETSDRTFEVSTRVAVRPVDLINNAKELPLTVPLVLYDALLDQEKRPAALPVDTIADYERKMIEEAQKAFPDFIDVILDDVLNLENALRKRAARMAEENARRSELVAVSNKLDGWKDDIGPAQQRLTTAIEARRVADEDVARLRGSNDDFVKRRKALVEMLTTQVEALRDQLSQAQDEAKAKEALEILNRRIGLKRVAIDALKTQSDETSILVPLRLTFGSIRLEDCSTGTTFTCTASIYVYPNDSETFPHEVLLYQPDPLGPAAFNVKFFEEDETPARATAYLVSESRAGKTAPPTSSVKLQAVASLGAAKDPVLVSRETSRNCPVLCEDFPYDGGERSRMTGSGRIELTQSYSNLLDGRVTLSFKEGDLGGGDTTTTVKLSDYRFNIYSQPGVTLHYGKYRFLNPSGGIAISETGEGARLAYLNLALTRIIKRESGKLIADKENRDNSVWVLELTNVSLKDLVGKKGVVDDEKTARRRTLVGRFLRTMSLYALQGEDRKGPEKQKDPVTEKMEMVYAAHRYETYGGQVGFTKPGLLYGNVAGYWSQRKVDKADAPCADKVDVCDGEGWVGLLAVTFPVTFPFKLGSDEKLKGNVTFTGGIGTGDDPETPTMDEGYIGETAGFAPDQIFLQTFAGAISTRDFFDVEFYKPKPESEGQQAQPDRLEEFRSLDRGVAGLGRGLSNKKYFGAKAVLNGYSPLATLARLLQISDIRSSATFLSVHKYLLRRPLVGDEDDAGFEADLEFNVETPRGVKVNLIGAYYWPGKAVETFIPKDAWSLSAGISLSL